MAVPFHSSGLSGRSPFFRRLNGVGAAQAASAAGVMQPYSVHKEKKQ